MNPHQMHAGHGGHPMSHVDWFTNAGHYMRRIDCLQTAGGGPDWFWIGTIIVCTVGVILAYLKIYYFWLRAYYSEDPQFRNRKMLGLANVFLGCALTGYAMSIVMFVWPAYRLYGIFMFGLVIVSWYFAYNLTDLRVALSAVRFKRQLEDSMKALQVQFDTTANLLSNMQQAIFVIDAGGTILAPVSKFSRELFGTAIEGGDVMAVLYRNVDRASEEYAAIDTTFRLVFGADEMQWSLVHDALPRSLSWTDESSGDRKSLEVAYKPLWNESGNLDRIMFVVEDVSALVAAESQLSEERDANRRAIAQIEQMVAHGTAEIEEYFGGSVELLERALVEISSLGAEPQGRDQRVVTVRRILHTIKGNSRMMGLQAISSRVHGVEQRVQETIETCGGDVDARDVHDALGAAWVEVLEEIRGSARVAERFLRIDNPVETFGTEALEAAVAHVDESIGSPESPRFRTSWSALGWWVKASDGSLEEDWRSVDVHVTRGEHGEAAMSWRGLRTRCKAMVTARRAAAAAAGDRDGDASRFAARCRGLTPMVADLSSRLGKPVQLHIDVEGVTVDVHRARSVQDALVQLVRNALDHGIEPEQVRAERGKPLAGTIALSARELEAETVITLTDDGAGIDVERVAARAVELGMVTSDRIHRMSDDEKRDLVFSPGLSTKSNVSDLSGRGLGADAARNAIERAGGTLEVFAPAAGGCRFEIRFPRVDGSAFVTAAIRGR